MKYRFVLSVFASLISVFMLKAEVLESHAVKIDETGYATLAEAFSAAQSGDTVELLKDIELTSQFVASGNKTVTLVGGEHTLESTVAMATTTYPSTDAGENFRLTNGFKLVIDSGTFTNVNFSAVSTSSATTSTITVNDGTFLGCELYAVDYASRVTINGGNFKGGFIVNRPYSSGSNPTVEINGGVFNDHGCHMCARGQYTGEFDINAGVFTNCQVIARGGNSNLVIGDPEVTDELKFVNCTIEAKVSTDGWSAKGYIKRGDFENCTIEANNDSQKYGTSTMEISDGNFVNCTIGAIIDGSSSVGGTTTMKLVVKGGNFTGGRVYGQSGDAPSGKTVSPQLAISGGTFNDVAVSVLSCWRTTATGKLTVSGGTFNYCAVVTHGYVTAGTISGGVFNGCKIGSHQQQHYSSNKYNATMTVSDMTGNGCLFFAKSTEGGGTAAAPGAATSINGGTFYGCTTAVYKDSTYPNASVSIGSGVSLAGSVASVSETGYSPLASAFSTLQSADSVAIELLVDSYSPISSDFAGWLWTQPERSSEVIEVAAGKTAEVSATGRMVDANLNVAGTVTLDGGYYTGTITILQGGAVRATIGTKFKQKPVGVLPVGSATIQLDENGDYVVVEVQSLMVSVTTDASVTYAEDSMFYGQDFDVFSGTPKTYTAAAEVALTENTRAVCTGWSLYSYDVESDSNRLVRESTNPGYGENVTTCIVLPESSMLTLVWHWKTQRYLALASADSAQGAVTGGGWHDDDAEVTISATPADGYVFSHWTGDTDALEDAYVSSSTFTLSEPVSLTAVFRPVTDCVFTYDAEGTVDFYDPACWQGGNAPKADGTSVVVLTRPSANVTVNITNALNVASFEAGFGSKTGSLTVVFGGGLVTNNVAGDVIIREGVMLTHTCHSTTDNSKKYELCLEAGGDITVESGASINVSGKGYYRLKGPAPCATTALMGAGHGGVGTGGYNSGTYVAGTAKCYGTIRRPDQPGGGGGYNDVYGYGGGVLHLIVTNGTLTVEGSLAANGGTTSNSSPAGGSIWIECGALDGAGFITAYSGVATGYSRGGGGRIAVKQNAANDLTAFTGYLRAGRNPTDGSYNFANSVGSIYIENADDEAERGELIVDGYGYSSAISGMACRLDDVITDVAEPFGQVTVKRYGRLEIPKGVTLSVTKGISVDGNSDFHTASSGGALEIMPGEDGTFAIDGLVKAYGVYCTNSPGATITFADGAELRNLENGSITLCGSEEKNVSLLPAAADAVWTLNVVGPDASLADLSYLAVSNCMASGVTLTGNVSENLGGNENWGFTTGIIPEGSVFIWTGTESADWYTPGNWNHGIVPRTADFVEIPSGLERYPVLTGYDLVQNSITNFAGASITLDGVDLYVTNAIYSAGAITCNGRKVAIAGDGEGSVADFAVAYVENVTVEKTAGSLNFPSGFTACTFDCVVDADVTFVFAPEATYEFGEARVVGIGDHKVTLSSAVPGEQWKLKVTGHQRFRNVNPSDSDASQGSTILVPAEFTDGGDNNVNWNLSADIVEWVGGVDTSWSKPGNWSTGVVPGETDNVYISADSGTYTVNTAGAVAVNTLTLGGGAGTVAFTSAYPVTTADDMVVHDGVTATLSSKDTANAIGGDLLVRSGATLTHAANGTSYTRRLYLSVAGDMTLEEGASIYLRNKGFAQYYGPVDGEKNDADAINGGSHGSTVSYKKCMDCYDSIFEPVMPGAGGYYDSGAGAVYLDVVGTLRIDGTIDARSIRGTNAPGGSGAILVKAGTLAGSGKMTAAGPDSEYSNYIGGAGRIALYQRTAADWSAAENLTVETVNSKSYNHSGTIYRELPGDGERGGEIYIEGKPYGSDTTCFVQFPMAEDGNPARAYKNATLVLGKNVDLRFVGSAGDRIRLRDIDFTDTGSRIIMNGMKVILSSRVHEDGEGWTGGDYSAKVDDGSITAGEGGGIEWVAYGFSIHVR